MSVAHSSLAMPLSPGSRPGHVLLTFPEDDRLFAQVVGRQIDGVRSRGIPVRTARRQLQHRYPDADLHRQENVLFGGVTREVWFAYRDGRSNSCVAAQPWWEARGTAHAAVSSEGSLTRANLACRTLLGLPSGRQLPVLLRQFLPRDLFKDLVALSGWLAAEGQITGGTTLRLPWGRRLKVEFHATWRGAGPRQHSVALRSIRERDAANDRQAFAASSLGVLSPAIRKAVRRGADRQELASGQRLAAAVMGEEWVALVVAGIVRLYVGSDGIEPTIIYGGVGSLLGTYLAQSEESFSVGLEAVTPSTLLLFNAGQVEALVGSQPRFARAVMSQGQTMLHDLALSLAARSSANLPQRLAHEITLLADLQPRESLVAVTEQQLADGVGSIRESIGRTIAGFRRDAWLATTRHGVIILDPDALRHAGNPEIH
jgi:CRP-like cAMP-binding protein